MSKKLNIQHVDFGFKFKFKFNATFNNISVVSFIGVSEYPEKTTDWRTQTVSPRLGGSLDCGRKKDIMHRVRKFCLAMGHKQQPQKMMLIQNCNKLSFRCSFRTATNCLSDAHSELQQIVFQMLIQNCNKLSFRCSFRTATNCLSDAHSELQQIVYHMKGALHSP